ncbi:medium-chain acyl-CoA ligase ACSF2, mitochondrial-like isoform X2 [Photinus pyralis]|uniref:medium-chain acyl-CoA ligase ACSF2, mitochondrial-like isoform X2 n=1 Tax=Photinus pyralis TaxID=7054 RepID=UPI0012674DBC|nr:medium-chain acyl-CoA ligase ACSF2, mitochondrial-like isoform X2 [Photinus pyralis]
MIRTSNLPSYIHNPGSSPLKYMTIGSLVEEAAKTYDQVTALVSGFDRRRLTYAEVLRQSDKLAAGLLSLGLKKGDRIGLWAPNIAEWAIAFFASARAGFITVALNPTYQADELRYCLNKCGVKALICMDEYKSLNFYDILCRLLPELKTCDAKSFSSDIVPTLKTVISISHTMLSGAYNYYQVVEMANLADVTKIGEDQRSISPDDICNIQYSSGTTGKPKGICLNHLQMVNNGYYIGKTLELNTENHRLCVQVPLFHVFGMVVCIMPSFHFGGTLVLPSPMYSPTSNLMAIEQERCNVIFGTPTMYHDLINLQSECNRTINLSKALIGAAAWSPKLLYNMKEVLKIKHIAAYGATETTAIVFLSMMDCDKLETKTVGKIGECIEAKVVDTNGQTLPFGAPGELCIRGYVTMADYWGEPDKTKEVMDSQRWLKTGDRFILHEDGSGEVVGRLKDVVIRGGENIFPREVEDFISNHPHINEVHVIGVDNERLGEELCACVQLRRGSDLDLDELTEFCKGRIANYKIPSQLRIVESFPKTASGKIQKYVLRQQFNCVQL